MTSARLIVLAGRVVVLALLLGLFSSVLGAALRSDRLVSIGVTVMVGAALLGVVREILSERGRLP